jgi:hypothetical protein
LIEKDALVGESENPVLSGELSAVFTFEEVEDAGGSLWVGPLWLGVVVETVWGPVA